MIGRVGARVRVAIQGSGQASIDIPGMASSFVQDLGAGPELPRQKRLDELPDFDVCVLSTLPCAARQPWDVSEMVGPEQSLSHEIVCTRAVLTECLCVYGDSARQPAATRTWWYSMRSSLYRDSHGSTFPRLRDWTSLGVARSTKPDRAFRLLTVAIVVLGKSADVHSRSLYVVDYQGLISCFIFSSYK